MLMFVLSNCSLTISPQSEPLVGKIFSPEYTNPLREGVQSETRRSDGLHAIQLRGNEHF